MAGFGRGERSRVSARRLLWWGRGDNAYARNQILRQCLRELGFDVLDFRPFSSASASLEARLRVPQSVDLVWVPAFRQRDVAGAAAYCRAHGLPLVFDPLISAYDKQVHERGKLSVDSRAAQQLLAWEQRCFAAADLLLADTPAHAKYFETRLGARAQCLGVVPVGADESLFTPAAPRHAEGPLELLFYGSFLALQGPGIIVEAARAATDVDATWTLLGEGPMRAECLQTATGLANVRFEAWLPYQSLPARIAAADVVLGVFGAGGKTARVVPNKVYQGMASARAVITARTPAYPAELLAQADSGIVWVPPADPSALAAEVASLASDRSMVAGLGDSARRSYERHFSHAAVCESLQQALRARALL